MTTKIQDRHIKKFAIFCVLMMISWSGILTGKPLSKLSVKPRMVIVLLDETDSFGRNATRGVSDSLYWNDALAFTKAVMKQLNPGDEFVVLAIDEKGFQDEDILIPFQQFERTFLKSKVQKNKLSQQIATLKRRKEKYSRTDILGALYQAAYFANQEPEIETVLFCFSDMRQEPRWPSLADAQKLSFPQKSRGYFFFVDASGREEWENLVNIWKPIFDHAGLQVSDNNSINFFQYGESALRLKRIFQEW